MSNNENNKKNDFTNKSFIKKNRKKIIFFVTLFIIFLIAGIIIAIVLKNTNTPKKDKTVQIHPLGGTIIIYKSDDNNSNQRAVILIPGGGYDHVVGDYEGADWVPLFKSLGYTTAVLRYTTPPKTPDGPLSEVIEAMKYLRNTSNGWNVDTGIVGVMGFSAGGHLASTAATHIKGDERPAFQVVFYPVITMDKNTTHSGSRENLLGLNPTQELVDLYSNEKQVTAETPPAYVCWTDDDKEVQPINSISYVEALKSKGVPVHAKNFKSGGHAYGFYKHFKYHDEMVEDFTQWLNNIDKILIEKTS